MFGTPVESVLGRLDSREERQVADALLGLHHEQYLQGVLVHPKVAGVTADFLVQLGPETNENGRVILLEYDGLGVDRPAGIEEKRDRYGRLSRMGMEARWLTSASEEAVKKVLTDYEAPRFVWRCDTCSACGRERRVLVIAPDHLGPEIERTDVCAECS